MLEGAGLEGAELQRPLLGGLREPGNSLASGIGFRLEGVVWYRIEHC